MTGLTVNELQVWGESDGSRPDSSPNQPGSKQTTGERANRAERHFLWGGEGAKTVNRMIGANETGGPKAFRMLKTV